MDFRCAGVVLSTATVALLCASGCTTVMVKAQAEDMCKKEGKQPFYLNSSFTGIPLMLESSGATVICVGPDDLVHMPETFGAEVVRATASLKGAAIFSVTKSSTADRAGLKPYDIVYAWGDRPIERPTDLQTAIEGTAAGTQVPLKVRRNKQEVTLSARF